MKKIFLATLTFFGLFLISSSKSVHAATLYWVGNDGANASVASNWKTTNPATCGSGDASAIPGASDTMNFDADCDNGAVIDSSFSSTVDQITLTSGYSGIVTLSNPISITSTSAFSGGTFTCSSGQSITPNGTVTVSGGTLTLTGCTTADFNGAFTITSGIFNAPSGTMTLTGSLTVSGGTGTFNANGGTVTFDGSTATIGCTKSDASVISFNLVTFNNTGLKTVSSGCNLPLGANPTFSSSGQITLAGTLSGSGTLTKTGQLSFNSGAVLSGFTGYSGTSFAVQGATMDLSNYTSFVASGLTNISSGSLTLPNGTDLNGSSSLTITSGTFTAPSGTMTVAGALTISGSPIFNANGGTITFDGSNATLACNNVTFSRVNITNTTGTKTVNSDCNLPLGASPTIGRTSLNGTLNGTGTLTETVNLFLNASTATLSGFDGLVTVSNFSLSNNAVADFSSYRLLTVGLTFSIDSGTTFTAPPIMSVRLFTNSGGTFNHNNGTVILINSSTNIITGSTTFYNLTKIADAVRTISFPADGTQTILGTLTLQGAGSGNKINLISSTTGLQYYFNVTGGRVLNNLNVQDANGIGNVYACSSCTDSGNNTNWSFINGSSIQFSLDFPAGNSHITNTSPTYRWSKATLSNNSAITKYELYIQPKDSNDNNIGTALYIDNISPFIGDNKKYQYSPTYTLYDDGDYLNLTPTNYFLNLGRYNFRVVAHDNAGNIAENSYNFWVDVTSPPYSSTLTRMENKITIINPTPKIIDTNPLTNENTNPLITIPMPSPTNSKEKQVENEDMFPILGIMTLGTTLTLSSVFIFRRFTS